MLSSQPRSQLPLYGLQVFECSARHLSFTLAADELCVSQGAVSKQIAQLEARLGHLLFVRGTRCLALTPAAERLLPFVREGLARIGEGLCTLQTLPHEQAISIRLPAPAAGCCDGCRTSRGRQSKCVAATATASIFPASPSISPSSINPVRPDTPTASRCFKSS